MFLLLRVQRLEQILRTNLDLRLFLDLVSKLRLTLLRRRLA
jgi:hypothetical protein